MPTDWVAYKPQRFISHVSGGWKPGCQHRWVLVKALSWAVDCQTLAVSSQGGRGKGAF